MATKDCTHPPHRPGYREFCDVFSVRKSCPMLMNFDQNDDFTWFNNTPEKQAGKIVFTCPDDGAIWGSGVPTCPICPGKTGRLHGMHGVYYTVLLKKGEPDIPFGKKMYLEIAADGSFVGATATPPAKGCSIGRAVIDMDQLRCNDADLIVAAAGAKCVRVYECPCYVPEVFG